MSKTKKRLMVAATGVALLTIAGTAAWGDYSPNKYLKGGPATQKIVVPTADVRETQSTEWADAPGSGWYSLYLNPGKTALVSARFTAASSCSEEGGSGEHSTCEARIQVGEFPGLPVSLVYPFDTTEHGLARKWELENHTLEAHNCFTNGTQYAKVIPVKVQWRVSGPGADGVKPTFLFANSSLTIDVNDGCTAFDKQ